MRAVVVARVVAAAVAATVVVGGALAARAAEPKASNAKVKQPQPAITLVPVDDKTFRERVVLDNARAQRRTLVQFWASYCAPCLDELPGLLARREELAKRGVVLAFVNVDGVGKDSTAAIERALRGRIKVPLSSFQVTNDDPQPFIDAVAKSWAGEVPFFALYGADGSLSKTLSGEQKIDDIVALVAP